MKNVPKIERIPIIERGDLEIDPQLHTVKVAGEEVTLCPKEFEVLYFLSQHPNWVLSSELYLKRYGMKTAINLLLLSVIQSLSLEKN